MCKMLEPENRRHQSLRGSERDPMPLLRHVENENEYASKASTSKGQMEARLTSNCGSGLALALSQGITRTTLLFSVFI